jgi:hypothetical protein
MARGGESKRRKSRRDFRTRPRKKLFGTHSYNIFLKTLTKRAVHFYLFGQPLLYSGRVKGERGKREGHWSFLFPRRGLIAVIQPVDYRFASVAVVAVAVVDASALRRGDLCRRRDAALE